MTVKITFWGTIGDECLPKDTFRNLCTATIKRIMRDALQANGVDGDIWAEKQTIDRTQWTEERFVMVMESGQIRDESDI